MSLLDLDDFEKVEEAANNAAAKEDLIGNFPPFGLASTTRPLITSSDEEQSVNKSPSPALPTSDYEFPDYVDVDKVSSLIDIAADGRVEGFRDSVTQQLQQRSDGDVLLIGNRGGQLVDNDSPILRSAPVVSVDKAAHEFEKGETLPKSNKKEPKIGGDEPKAESENNFESLGFSACESIAFVQPPSAKSEVAMEAETVGNENQNSETECPFSPGAWFNAEKLHPLVAEYVYWRDPKKSGIAFVASLVLLLSLKYFSFISVIAYLTLALLTVTVSFRIYKNVLQAVQKSNEGHPFKEYLDMDITLSQDKVSETVETLIHHVNCVTGKLRSLVLVEDLFDTLKLSVLAWSLTYIGAWFNGMTLLIITLVIAFTLPKVYETNKVQIDMYAEILRTKGKEMIEMVNAKMPLCKKKKE